MNAKTERQISEMKNQTIGVEVEMNNIKRSKAAKIAADFFGTGRYENTASRNGYMTWSAWDADGREWKFQKDVSISGADDEKCEMVTPILTYSDIETLQEEIRRLFPAVPDLPFSIADGRNRIEFPYDILAPDHVQSATIVPSHHERSGIVNTLDGSPRTDGRCLHVFHADKLHTGAGGIIPADAFHRFFIRKSHDQHLRS